MDERIRWEATGLLTKLIRIDTTNPPGNETSAAQMIHDYLSHEGYEPEIIESSEGRGSVIARLTGDGDKSLMLLSHLDVVPANPKVWSVDPFSGEVKDGFVWGRGAIDCKGLVATEALAMAILKREGFKPKGDVIFAATADEERGGAAGAAWLVENHPEKVRAELMINEGGGLAIPIMGKNHYLVQVAEKGVYWTRLRTKGRSCHSSVPALGENAVVKMAAALERLFEHKPPLVALDLIKELLKRLGGIDVGGKAAINNKSVEKALKPLKEISPSFAESILSTMRMTIAPTMIKGGVKENIIPDTCEAVVDCRLLPGQDTSYLKEQFANALWGLDGVEMEPILASPGTISPHNTDFFRILEEALSAADPGCVCVPTMSNGGTDSRFFREKFGTMAYGLRAAKLDLPIEEQLRLTHGADERVSQENLLFRTKLLVDIVKRTMR